MNTGHLYRLQAEFDNVLLAGVQTLIEELEVGYECFF
jgi:hypothetical protein